MTCLDPTQNLRTKIRHIDVAVEVRYIGARRPEQSCPAPRVFSSQNASLTLFCRLQLAMPLAAEESVSKRKFKSSLMSSDIPECPWTHKFFWRLHDTQPLHWNVR